MKITQCRQVYEEVNLNEESIYEVTVARLTRLLDGGRYLRTDNNGVVWLKQDDPYHRHGSISEVNVREATELDVAVCTVLKGLKLRKP